MSLKSRLSKIEQRINDSQQLAVIILQPGMTEDQALHDWQAETGKPEPGFAVYIQRFTDRPLILG